MQPYGSLPSWAAPVSAPPASISPVPLENANAPQPYAQPWPEQFTQPAVPQPYAYAPYAYPNPSAVPVNAPLAYDAPLYTQPAMDAPLNPSGADDMQNSLLNSALVYAPSELPPMAIALPVEEQHEENENENEEDVPLRERVGKIPTKGNSDTMNVSKDLHMAIMKHEYFKDM